MENNKNQGLVSKLNMDNSSNEPKEETSDLPKYKTPFEIKYLHPEINVGLIAEARELPGVFQVTFGDEILHNLDKKLFPGRYLFFSPIEILSTAEDIASGNKALYAFESGYGLILSFTPTNRKTTRISYSHIGKDEKPILPFKGDIELPIKPVVESLINCYSQVCQEPAFKEYYEQEEVDRIRSLLK